VNQQFQESLALAQNKPDLKKLDAEVKRGSTTILTLTRPRAVMLRAAKEGGEQVCCRWLP